MGMKLRDVECTGCGCFWEDFVDSGKVTGDAADVACPLCGFITATVVLACAPNVRTPNNSATFLDGHRDDGGRMKHASETLKAQSAFEAAKYQGKGDVKETYKALMEHRGKIT